MNRLFKKISMAFVGIAMAVGVGVAVGSNREARMVKADAPENLTFQLTINTSDFDSSGGSYAIEDAKDRSKNAVCVTDGYTSRTQAVSWKTNQIMYNSNKGKIRMQWKKNVGYLYNTVAINGTLTGVTINSDAGTFTTTYGTACGDAGASITSATPGGTFFKVAVGDAIGKTTSVVVTFSVPNKKVVTLNASNQTIDLNDEDLLPAVTDGTSPVVGFNLSSSDPYVASIVDGKIHPVGYGKCNVTISKDTDESNIYTSKTIEITVTDTSKTASSLVFDSAVDDSVDADDGLTWGVTITGKQSTFSESLGIKFGTNKDTFTSVSFAASSGVAGRVRTIVVTASDTSASDVAELSVSVGGVLFTPSTRGATLNSTNAPYHFTGAGFGEIVVAFERASAVKAAMYIKSIVVLYEASSDYVAVATFVQTYMHLTDYDPELHVGNEGDGDCKGNGKDYYGKNTETGAKHAFNSLTTDQRAIFMNETYTEFASARARLSAWATANGDVLNGSNPLTAQAVVNLSLGGLDLQSSNLPLIIAVATIGTVAAAGVLLFSRKRRNED